MKAMTRSKWIALISIGLNVFLIAHIAADWHEARERKWMRPSERMEKLVSQLPQDKQALLRPRLEAQREAMKQQREKMRETRQAVREIMETEPFDPVAAGLALQAQRESLGQMIESMHQFTVEMAAHMPLELRKELIPDRKRWKKKDKQRDQ